jgi:hypothetical protein
VGESDVAYHPVRCATIQDERLLSSAEARQTIREHFEGHNNRLSA